MTMPSYKLTYFNMRGRAELPRYIFAYAGIAFEDRRVEWRDWPSIKKTFPLGKLPVLEVNGLPLTQSLAIARFLAKEAGLVGNSRLAEAQADALVDTLNDFTLLIPWREDNPQIKDRRCFCQGNPSQEVKSLIVTLVETTVGLSLCRIHSAHLSENPALFCRHRRLTCFSKATPPSYWTISSVIWETGSG
ncbi:hematopoietic prostaglandin D synthase isoform X2 [Salvelinus sp. IW2-2015]|uniref:hematopoietic prostaglandin D synthase isoform X2 n=1 Tax=Salvelinus sp. IW2-2015 TaxID=2691554 RepID=UPI000CDF650C|nr:hematopoietic prostaglandin D synthase isoform X3 [Salvelinus alpinus]